MIHVYLKHLWKCVNLTLQAPADALAKIQLVSSSYNCPKHDTCAQSQDWRKGERHTGSMLVPWLVGLMSGPSNWVRLVGTSAASASSICRQHYVSMSNVRICLLGMSGDCTASPRPCRCPFLMYHSKLHQSVPLLWYDCSGCLCVKPAHTHTHTAFRRVEGCKGYLQGAWGVLCNQLPRQGGGRQCGCQLRLHLLHLHLQTGSCLLSFLVPLLHNRDLFAAPLYKRYVVTFCFVSCI